MADLADLVIRLRAEFGDALKQMTDMRNFIRDVGVASGLTGQSLQSFRNAIDATMNAGGSLTAALVDMSVRSAVFGAEISGAARKLLDAQLATQEAANANAQLTESEQEAGGAAEEAGEHIKHAGGLSRICSRPSHTSSGRQKPWQR